MALSYLLQELDPRALLLGIAFLAGVVLACWCLYRIYLHPLSKVPGPKIAACTSHWLAYHTYIGDECTVVFDLHKKYGPVLRVAPNDLDIANGDAIEPIYLSRGGFPKTAVYSKFDIDGHPTIFSTLTLPERASRAKAVAPLFSTTSIRNSQESLCTVIDDFVHRLRKDAQSGRPVNVLQVARSMAIDAVSAYLFQERYGALAESADVMSASPFVDAYVGVGAFFNFAYGRLGDYVVGLVELLSQKTETAESFSAMDRYTSQLMKKAIPKSGSYQSRLLEKVSVTQSQIETKDVCFAGTDSTSMNTATILWYLAKYPEIYTRLQTEIKDTVSKGQDPISTPYLRGVVREGLRLSWANPIRLPRMVPTGGWQYGDYFFPAGTSVGVASFQLHQDEKIFPDPQHFIPERWLQPTDEMLNYFMAFGKGTRACIAQNLGTMELMLATMRVAQEDVLRGARVVQDRIEIKEWFNSRVKGEKILIQFDRGRSEKDSGVSG